MRVLQKPCYHAPRCVKGITDTGLYVSFWTQGYSKPHPLQNLLHLWSKFTDNSDQREVVVRTGQDIFNDTDYELILTKDDTVKYDSTAIEVSMRTSVLVPEFTSRIHVVGDTYDYPLGYVPRGISADIRIAMRRKDFLQSPMVNKISARAPMKSQDPLKNLCIVIPYGNAIVSAGEIIDISMTEVQDLADVIDLW